MKKKVLSLIGMIILINIISVTAINLEITSKSVSNSYLIELNDPAVFDLIIKNLDKSDSFQIYSLVGINITHEPFRINKDETEIVRIYLTPQDYLRSNPQSYTFEYKIKNSKNEIKSETLTINIVSLNSAFSINPTSINPKSEKINVNMKNNLMKNLKNVKFKLKSEFFNDYEKELSFGPNEIKKLEININKNELKTLTAGNYILNSQISLQNNIVNLESKIRFLEDEGVEISESEEGSIMQRTEIVKKNIGNTKQLVAISQKKNFIAYLFTTTNIPPTKVETDGFYKNYIWEKVLNPDEELRVVTRTNWLFPIIIIIIIIIGAGLIRKSIYDNLELTKKVSFVKTKGGEFALKVSVKARAKKQIEKIKIIDRLPFMVKLYDKFGMISPDKIDLESRKLYWNIPKLNKGETRIFTYIIYSKIGVFGRIELPETKAVYEENGESKETYSNKSFYVREENKL